jgi:hypothetical protein
VRLVRKRKVLALNGQFRPKRPENGLYQGHTARASAGNSTSEALLNPGGPPSASICYAHDKLPCHFLYVDLYGNHRIFADDKGACHFSPCQY